MPARSSQSRRFAGGPPGSIKRSGTRTASKPCIRRDAGATRSEVMASAERYVIPSPGSNSAKPIRSADEFLIFGAPLIGDEEKREVLHCLETGWLGTGPKVAQLEREFREYKGATYAVAVNSCTAALHLSMLAAGIGPGDEVITTALTFAATVNAIIHA